MSSLTDSVETIQDKLIRYIESDILVDRDRTTVSVEEPLFAGLLDSLDTLRLVVFLEEQFQIQVQDGEMSPENFENVRRLAEYIKRKSTGA
jgi:acyl carrier protein